MTREKFSVRCKEITAAKELTREAKIQKIGSLSTSLIEDIFSRTPEIRDWRKREEAAIKKHAGHGGFSYCPHDGEWSPSRPPVIKALDLEWEDIFKRKVEETRRKALTKLAA